METDRHLFETMKTKCILYNLHYAVVMDTKLNYVHVYQLSYNVQTILYVCISWMKYL